MTTVAKKATPAAIAVLRQATALRPKRKKASDGLLSIKRFGLEIEVVRVTETILVPTHIQNIYIFPLKKNMLRIYLLGSLGWIDPYTIR